MSNQKTQQNTAGLNTAKTKLKHNGEQEQDTTVTIPQDTTDRKQTKLIEVQSEIKDDSNR